jgi:CheY-like chemotaxis protein
MQVLVADDHPETMDMISTFLTASGHKVFSASDGEQALELLHLEVPDVCMIDLALPKLDGFRVASFMRKFSRFKDTRLIAFTGLVDEANYGKAAESGFDFFISKPVSPTTIEVFVEAPKPDVLLLTSVDLRKRSERLLKKAANLSQRCKVIRERAAQIRAKLDPEK